MPLIRARLVPATAANARDTTNTSRALTPASLLDAGVLRKLFTAADVDMNSTADQLFTKFGAFTTYTPFFIRIFADAAASSAVGGVYDAVGKTGNIIVAAGQVHTGLTGANAGANVTIAITTGQKVLTNTPMVSLSTPHGSASTANWEIWGEVRS